MNLWKKHIFRAVQHGNINIKLNLQIGSFPCAITGPIQTAGEFPNSLL